MASSVSRCHETLFEFGVSIAYDFCRTRGVCDRQLLRNRLTMLRKTLTIPSLLGLLLSVGLWGVSYVRITYKWNSVDAWHHFFLSAGMFVLYVAEGHGYEGWHVEGFRGFHTGWTPHIPFSFERNYAVFIPIWLTTLIFGTMFWLCHPLHHHRRRTRRKRGLCVKCGYDLRASKDRCPECGSGVSD